MSGRLWTMCVIYRYIIQSSFFNAILFKLEVNLCLFADSLHCLNMHSSALLIQLKSRSVNDHMMSGFSDKDTHIPPVTRRDAAASVRWDSWSRSSRTRPWSCGFWNNTTYTRHTAVRSTDPRTALDMSECGVSPLSPAVWSPAARPASKTHASDLTSSNVSVSEDGNTA